MCVSYVLSNVSLGILVFKDILKCICVSVVDEDDKIQKKGSRIWIMDVKVFSSSLFNVRDDGTCSSIYLDGRVWMYVIYPT